jgi:hypothetical protein
MLLPVKALYEALDPVTFAGRVRELRETQFRKAPIAMDVRPSGRITDLRDLQPEKISRPIPVGLRLSRVTDVRDVQPLKAYSPMVSTPSRVMDVREAQPSKA